MDFWVDEPTSYVPVLLLKFSTVSTATVPCSLGCTLTSIEEPRNCWKWNLDERRTGLLTRTV
jgi:hypothetical protein